MKKRLNEENDVTQNSVSIKPKKHKVVKIVLWFIAALIAIRIAGSVSQSSKDNSDGDNVKADASNVKIEETTKADKDKKYNVGETYSYKDFDVTYTECGELTEYNKFMPPKDGNKIIYATFDISNNSSSDRSALYTDFKCYADGYACDGYYATEGTGLSFSERLSAGRKCTGKVAFEVPENAEDIEIEYSPSFWSSKKAIFVYK